jgi:hypothetical protein
MRGDPVRKKKNNFDFGWFILGTIALYTILMSGSVCGVEASVSTSVGLDGEWEFRNEFTGYKIAVEGMGVYRDGYRVGRIVAVVFPVNNVMQNQVAIWIGEEVYYAIFSGKDIGKGEISGVGMVVFYGVTGRDVWKNWVATKFSLVRVE